MRIENEIAHSGCYSACNFGSDAIVAAMQQRQNPRRDNAEWFVVDMASSTVREAQCANALLTDPYWPFFFLIASTCSLFRHSCSPLLQHYPVNLADIFHWSSNAPHGVFGAAAGTQCSGGPCSLLIDAAEKSLGVRRSRIGGLAKRHIMATTVRRRSLRWRPHLSRHWWGG